MRHGHMKRLVKPKRGKAALRAEANGQGSEVCPGRSAFKRSLNHHKHQHRDWYQDPTRTKVYHEWLIQDVADALYMDSWVDEACSFEVEDQHEEVLVKQLLL